jgi:hypothetical protein
MAVGHEARLSPESKKLLADAKYTRVATDPLGSKYVSPDRQKEFSDRAVEVLTEHDLRERINEPLPSGVKGRRYFEGGSVDI